MPTISQQLTQLEQDRQDLVDNLETQGITGLSGDETFTELVPEVLNISGGGTAITTIEEATQATRAIIMNLNNYLLNIPNNYNVYTQNQVNLYTPSAIHNYYCIRYRDLKYQILWLPSRIIYLTSSTMNTQLIMKEDVSQTSVELYGSQFIEYAMYSNVSIVYLSPQYNTLQEALDAIQSPNTVYTTVNNSQYGITKYSNDEYVPYLNIPAYLKENGVNIYYVGTKISSNETISVIE